MTSTDRPLPEVEQLRTAADARVRARITAAARRREQLSYTRAAFGLRRTAGVQYRNSAKAARHHPARHHGGPGPGCTAPAPLIAWNSTVHGHRPSGVPVIKLERVADWAAERSLYQDLYRGLPVPMPELTRSTWPPPAGVVAARRDGQLLGWAVFFADADADADADAYADANAERGGPDHGAVLQWILVARERQRITSGWNTEHGVTADESELLAALAAAAAEGARAAGYRALRWWEAEPGFAQSLAERTGAQRAEGADGPYRLAW
ncbi:hypothetical protein [Streptacidiphilus sp. PAMC 29251]